jgi:hypothetical protein
MSAQMLHRILDRDSDAPFTEAGTPPRGPVEIHCELEGPPAIHTIGTPRPRQASAGLGIDSILGPAEDRFFGSGYRRVSQQILGLTWHGAPDAEDAAGAAQAAGDWPVGRRATGRAAVTCPPDWSSKAGAATAPHLTSVDALALSTWLVEALLVNGYELRAGQLSRAWLRRFVMKSGAEPYEDLDNVGLDIIERERHPSRLLPGGWSSHFDCSVGNIRVRCEIEHDTVFAPRPVGPDRPELVVPAARRHATAYRDHLHEITDIILDLPSRVAAATVRSVDAAAPARAADELGGAYQPAGGLQDSMIVLAQVGQALLYELDGLDRTQTNNLWMRRVDMWRDNPHQPLDIAESCVTRVKRSSVVDYAGSRWRASNIAGRCGGTTVEYSVGHQLPVTGDGAQ